MWTSLLLPFRTARHPTSQRECCVLTQLWAGTQPVSAEELIGNQLPPRHVVLCLFRREEVDAKLALLGLQRRLERRHAGMRRDVVRGAKHLLPFLRDDEIDQ